MRFIIKLLMMVITAGIMVAGIVFVLAKALGQMALQPGSKAWDRAVQRLRERLRAQQGKLVPWEGDTLSLLSLNRTDETKPGFFGGEFTGLVTTIYHEPVVAFARNRGGRNSLLLAQTSRHEYVFRIKEKETEILLNGQPLGTYSNGQLLGPGRSPQLLARVEADAGESQFPLVLGSQTVATLTNPARPQSPNPRALQLLRELNPDEENLALAIAVLQMLNGARV